MANQVVCYHIAPKPS